MKDQFRYVSAKPGHLVTRYGTKSHIGAVVGSGGAIEYQPNAVVVIPEAEWMRFVREYTRLVNAGVLIEKKEADYKASIAAAENAAAGASARADAEAKARLAEAANASAPSDQPATDAAPVVGDKNKPEGGNKPSASSKKS